jgi:hypothetical protein
MTETTPQTRAATLQTSPTTISMDRIKISELIALLQKAMAEHGNLPCVYEHWGFVNPTIREVAEMGKVMDLGD